MLLELGVGADILRGIGWLIWLLIAVALWVAFAKPKTKLGKAVAVSLVLGVGASIFVPEAIRQYEHKKRYAKAKALFEERCKTAGEKIYRTVERVEGVFLMRLRSVSSPYWFDDQYTTYDIFAGEDGGAGSIGSRSVNNKERKPPPDAYILSFLRPVLVDPPTKDSLGPSFNGKYFFVETEDPVDGKLYRYTASYFAVNRFAPNTQSWVRDISLEREPIPSRTARYGISWEDETGPGDRDWWIAGSSVRVVDLESQDVLAQRMGFVMDPALGSKAGFRSPWGFARPCTSYAPKHRQTSHFVERVLKPTEKTNP